MSLHRRHAIAELIQFVRTNSAFYKQSLSKVTEGAARVEDLPLTDNDAYWKASNDNLVMTAPLIDGAVLRSGGSTGTPKMVYMTKQELRTHAQVMAVALAQGCGLVSGDRIANMAHHGSLYGSFMLFNTAIMELPVPTVHLPISGNESVENQAKWMEQFGATVVLTNVSNTRRLAEHFSKQGKTMPGVRLLLYTGEAFSKELRATYRAAFPNAIVYPSLYGSVDAGVIGIPAQPSRGGDEDINPVYKVLSPLLVAEILDESLQPIKENGKKGTMVITHLVKRQQPMLRYPVGDNASWVDYEAETFRLHGRDSVSLKISTTHLPLSFLREAIVEVLGEGVASGSQFAARRDLGLENAQKLVCRIVAAEPANSETILSQLEKRIADVSPTWTKNRGNGNIAPLEIEWITSAELVLRPTTGKLVDIIEERL